MANTNYLKRTVEDYVRAQLAREFGVPFRPGVLQLVTGGTHEFDAVSEDGSVVAGIKAASGKTSGGRTPVGKIKSAIAELYFLSLVSVPRRILVLTDPEFYQILSKRLEGRLAEGLELKLIRLPADIQCQVDKVRRDASREVSPGINVARS